MNLGFYYTTGSSSVQDQLIQGSSTTLTGIAVLIYNEELNGSTANPSQVGHVQFKSGAQVNLTPMSSGT